MITYNKTWRDNLRVLHQAEQADEQGHISADELKGIKGKYPVGFYTPNLFIRIGLFILTFIIVLFSCGLIGLVVADAINSEIGFAVLLMIGGLGLLAILEAVMIKDKHHYRSGVDDALLYCGAFMIMSAVYIILSKMMENLDLYPEIPAFLLCIFTIILTLRYADSLACTTAYLSFFFCCYSIIIKSSSWGIALAPFLLIIISALVYNWSYRTEKKPSAINYEVCLIILQVASLTTLYLSGNYFIVRELGGSISGLPEEAPLPLGWFFWLWTIAIPFVYIGLGIKKKNVVLLRMGLLLIIISVLTFRNYHHVLSVEAALTLAGIGAIGIAYSIIKYLTPAKNGFTYEDSDEKHLMDKLNVEAVVIAQSFGPVQTQTTNEIEFGGGDFGGGGAGDKF